MSRPIVFLDTETTSLAPWREPWEIAMIRRDEQGDRAVSFFVSPIDLRMADPMSLAFSRFYERHPDFDGPEADYLGFGYGFGEYRLIEKKLADYSDGQPFRVSRNDAALLVHYLTRDAFIVGAVPNFDMDMLHAVLASEKLSPAWRYHLRDVEAMAVGYLAARGMYEPFSGEDWKSDDLSKECGVKPPSDEERHTALGDARWAMRWYDAVMRESK